jgi:hypothetical protein
MKNPASPGFCFVTTKFFSAWISTRSIRAGPCDVPLDLDAMLTDVARGATTSGLARSACDISSCKPRDLRA